MVTDESDRRLNLYFDDLDLDILEWLNSFGKRKRARVAKEALRRAMHEGFREPTQQSRAPYKSPTHLTHVEFKEKGINTQVPIKQTAPEANELNGLIIDLVGVENDTDILDYLDKSKGVSF